MVLLTRTALLASALGHAGTCTCAPRDLSATCASLAQQASGTVPFSAVSSLAPYLRACPRWGGAKWAHELVRGAEVVLEAPERRKAEPAPELLRRRVALQNALDASRYRQMVGDVSLPERHQEQLEIARSTKGNMYLALNLLVAMGTCFVVGRHLGGVMYGSNSLAANVCGIIGLIGALLVEAVLLIIHVSREEEMSRRASAPSAIGVGKGHLPPIGGKRTTHAGPKVGKAQDKKND
eukprot:m51a1_g7497 hypothetical protein (237) ;mRNA; f:259816-260680